MSPPMPDLDSLTADQRLALLTAAKILQKEFAGVFSTETIELFLQTSYDQFADRAFTNFLPLMAERFARQRLTAWPEVEGKHSDGTPIVLFLCVHNGPVADGIGLVQPARRRAIAWSGGWRTEVNPAAIESCEKLGSTSRRSSPSRGPTRSCAADVVVTMGCGDACPIFPGKRYEDWELDDPEGLDVEGADPRRDRGGVRGCCQSSGSSVTDTPSPSGN